MKSDVPRHRGKVLKPKIKNVQLPFGKHEFLFNGNSIVLDTSMGYGCDIALVKKLFPNSEVHGIDLNIVMTDRIWEGGKEFTYGMARKVVREALGDDVLPLCKVNQGNALKLDGFEPDYFNRVLSFYLIHHLRRSERIESFKQAYRVLKKNGVFVTFSYSGEGLEKFTKLKGKYDWERIRLLTREREPNTNLDSEARARFEEDVRKIYPDYDKLSEGDRYRVDRVATNKYAFHMQELISDIVERDLRDIGFASSASFQENRPDSILKFLTVFAKK